MQAVDSCAKFPFLFKTPQAGVYNPFSDSIVADTPLPDTLGPLGWRHFVPTNAVISRPARPDFGTMRKSQDIDWITGILVLCFVLLAWVRFNNNRRLKQVLKACLSARYVSRLQREGNLFNERIMLALGAIYISTISLFILSGVQQFELLEMNDIKPPFLFAAIILFLISFWLFKAIVVRFLASIFNTNPATENYQLNGLYFNITHGLILLPLLPLIIYPQLDFVFWLALGLTIALYIYSIFRRIIIGLTQTRFPLYYLLIFIFSIEILPLLILAKSAMLYFDMHPRDFLP